MNRNRHADNLPTPLACTVNPVNLFCLFTGESVRWPQTLPPFIAKLVIVWHGAHRHVPTASANPTAEPGRGRAIRLYVEQAAAHFALFFNHEDNLPHIACKRIEDAYKQGDLFIEPPAKAEQMTFNETPG